MTTSLVNIQESADAQEKDPRNLCIKNANEEGQQFYSRAKNGIERPHNEKVRQSTPKE